MVNLKGSLRKAVENKTEVFTASVTVSEIDNPDDAEEILKDLLKTGHKYITSPIPKKGQTKID